MKKITLYFFSLALFTGSLLCRPSVVKAQFNDYTDSSNVFRMPVGYTRIGDENYFGLRLQPELTFGKLGFGLNIPVFFSLDDGSFRSEEYKSGTGWFRLIDFVRYGVKERDKFYVRLGSLYRSYLGYGILLNNYTNAASFERRKVGLEFDVRLFKLFGFEGAYSDFDGFNNLWAFRPYVRPLAKTNLPILKTLEIGYGVVTDHDESTFDFAGEPVSTQLVRDGMTSWSIDMGVTLINTKLLNLTAYGQYGRLTENGALADSVDRFLASLEPGTEVNTAIADGYQAGGGFNIGVEAKIRVIANLLNLDVRLERLWQDEHFLPQFFDQVYEVDKDAKIWLLANTPEVNSTYAVLSATILKKLIVSGGLRIPDVFNEENPALLQLTLRADDFIPKFIIRGSYVKGDLATLGEAFTLDERSQLAARLAYRITSFFVAGVDYRWTFAQTEQDSGQERYKATSYVMPYFGLNFPLFRNNDN